jgi:tRNA pseudouridine32 synthase / 23S rRNA pseudouridine746 synthase
MENTPQDAMTTTSTGIGNVAALQHIPLHLRIRILHANEHIVVIDKPGNLRSVPGNADSEHKQTAGLKRRRREDSPSTGRLSVQEAWAEAIKILSRNPTSSVHSIDHYLVNLGTPESAVASVPRKFKTFQRYIQRSRQRIFGGDRVKGVKSEEETNQVIQEMYQKIEEQQKLLLNAPESTAMDESAFGQVLLWLGHSVIDTSMQPSLFAVHRLDCATSGIMVFTRTDVSASVLSKAWRDRTSVHKTYVALVREWPLWSEQGKEQGDITLSLAPSEECIKWKVCDNGKACKTLWKVLPRSTESNIRLELTPVTGRTHQLRLHCAAVGSGIIGDTLYGQDATSGSVRGTVLCLHAYKLSFPHPGTNDVLTFISDAPW